MCTLTAERRSDRRLITMNRDEARTRGEELPPALLASEADSGADFPKRVAPIDRPSGGTWFGVNDRGVVAGLLNLYDDESAPPAPRGTTSRGILVPEVLTTATIDDAVARATSLVAAKETPPRFSPFRLAIFAPDGDRLVVWSREQQLSVEELPGDAVFLSSSSWRAPEVLPWREERYHAWRESGAPHRGSLPTFHIDQPEDLSEWAPLMAREKSSTRSISQVEIPLVADATAELRYWGRPTTASDAPDVIVPLPLV